MKVKFAGAEEYTSWCARSADVPHHQDEEGVLRGASLPSLTYNAKA